MRYSKRGGARVGAGRPKKRDRGVSHARRPALSGREPVHATLRVLDHVYHLRTRRCFELVFAAMVACCIGEDFRVVGLTVQGHHLHLLVEAAHARALSRGIQAIAVRLAKGLNRLMGRHGQVFERFHARPLRTPREVRPAMAYIARNTAKHAAQVRSSRCISSSVRAPRQEDFGSLAPAATHRGPARFPTTLGSCLSRASEPPGRVTPTGRCAVRSCPCRAVGLAGRGEERAEGGSMPHPAAVYKKGNWSCRDSPACAGRLSDRSRRGPMRFPVVAIALLCLRSLPACDAQECEDHAVGMFPLLACGNYDFHGQADGEPFRCTFSYDCLGSEGDTTFSPGPCSGPVRLEGGPSITPVFPGTPAVIDWVLERTGYPDGEHETTQGTAVPSYRRQDGCQVAFVPIADGA